MAIVSQILTSGRPRSDIRAIWLKWQVQMDSLSKVAVPMPSYILPLEASRGLRKPKLAILAANLDFRDIPRVILA